MVRLIFLKIFVLCFITSNTLKKNMQKTQTDVISYLIGKEKNDNVSSLSFIFVMDEF